MKRRNFLAGAATAALGRTPLAQPALGTKAKTLIHVPQANLTSLDPVWTTALVTRNYAAMVFETLYGRDEQLDPRPQMVEGHQVENKGCAGRCACETGWRSMMARRCWRATALPRCNAG